VVVHQPKGDISNSGSKVQKINQVLPNVMNTTSTGITLARKKKTGGKERDLKAAFFWVDDWFRNKEKCWGSCCPEFEMTRPWWVNGTGI